MTACLLLHGFTSGSWEMEGLGNYLFSHGISVECPLLPGHGTTPEELSLKTWIDWHLCASDAFRKLRNLYDNVIVCGQSLGGCLALHLAAHYPADAVITLGAGTKINDTRVRFLRFYRLLINNARKKKPSDVSDLTARSNHRTYNVYPLAAVSEVVEFYRHLEDDLADVRAPLLLFHSTSDHTIPYSNADFILSHVSSSQKKLITLTKSYHLLTLDVERENIFEQILNFISEISAKKSSLLRVASQNSITNSG